MRVLFTSYSFLFVFLPLIILASQGTARYAPQLLTLLMLVFSVVFYGLWGMGFLVLLACMVCMNYAFGLMLFSMADPEGVADSGEKPGEISSLFGFSRRSLLVLALVFNLLPLLWFKYSGFFVQNIGALLHMELNFQAPGLPLGISFYTFIQIAWLMGIYRRQFSPHGIVRHALFSSFFPYVISGPIVRYDQMGPQFDNAHGATAAELAGGLALFSVGLAKKVILADSIALYANNVFNAAEKGFPISGCEAWLGSLCYTFQLYFDFSGYTDMALGIGLMLGMRLPENFNSPYKSTGIVDFWRRWHITLGAWLRDFLYIPLGGNRHGRLKQYRNLFLTMLIGGAWHGAGWTFIIWGALHGAMLSINHFFRARIKGSALEAAMQRAAIRVPCIIVTFICLNFCWVVFRAVTLEGAWRIYAAMFTGPFALGGLTPNHYFPGWQGYALLLVSAAIVWCLPSSHEIFRGRRDGTKPWLSFRPSAAWASVLAGLAFVALLLASRGTTFLYFQF